MKGFALTLPVGYGLALALRVFEWAALWDIAGIAPIGSILASESELPRLRMKLAENAKQYLSSEKEVGLAENAKQYLSFRELKVNP